MSDVPTRELIDGARAQVTRMVNALGAGLLTSLAPGAEADALRVLLAATAPRPMPTEEQVARVRHDAFDRLTRAAGRPPSTAPWEDCADEYRERCVGAARAVLALFVSPPSPTANSLAAEMLRQIDDPAARADVERLAEPTDEELAEEAKPLARVALDWNARDSTYHVWLDLGRSDDNPRVKHGLTAEAAHALADRINARAACARREGRR